MLRRRIYYGFKPFLPPVFQMWLRRYLVRKKLQRYSHVWPIDEKAAAPPEGWSGWPQNKKFALVLTHDVETAQGRDKCLQLMALEKELGFRSSFNFVPERYDTSQEIFDTLRANGFEIGVHGLKHDGKLYSSSKVFKRRVLRINRYLKEWNAVGFRSPAMHHNLEWINDLNIEYDASTFDTDPFEPQPDGVGTIFPFVVDLKTQRPPYIELPYTLPQDSTLFLFMQEKAIDVWTRKLDWIAQHGGMALVITHPDYMNFDGKEDAEMEYSAQLYTKFLNHIQSKYSGQYWQALPREIARFFRNTFVVD